jgi:hypothetical protein
MKKTLQFTVFLIFVLAKLTTAQVPDYVPADNLIGWWPFNGTANDESGNGNNGAVNGATLITDRFGATGKAYDFQGTNISVSMTSLLHNNPVRSFSVWFYANGPQNGGRIYETTYLNGGIALYNNNILDAWYSNAQNEANVTNVNTGELNKWHHLVYITNCNTGLGQIYLDGVLTASRNGAINTAPQNWQNKFMRFGIGASGESFNGRIDDIGVWSRVLTQTEITNLYNSCAPPTITGTTPLSRCDAGTVALGASASSGTINWYSSSTGGSSLQTGTSFTTPSINSTTTYYVDATNNGCTSSSRTAIVATVNTTPTIIGTTPLSRCDAGTVALGASASSGTINWYSSSTGGSSLQTGTSFTTPSINTTTTYYVDATNNDCTSSSRTAVVATVNTTPTISGTTPLSRCDAGTGALGASASSGTINWYSSSTGGSSLQTGASFTTPSINTTTTYYVDATSNGCTSSSRTAVVATVNTIPTISGTTPLSRCDAGTVALGASASSGTINWYSNSTGGSSLQAGTSFTTPSINTTTTYYIDATNNGCTSSSRTAVVATVNASPTITGTTPLSRCDAGAVPLGASASSGTINWYSSSTGGSSLQTGTSFTTPSINTTTNYYVDATNNGCTSSSRTAIVATVNTVPTISGTTPLSRCDAGTVALGASASSGTINWYSSSTGGSSLQTGASFTTPSINTTTTYYVDATSNGCTSSSRTAVVASVNTTPTISGTTPLSRCDAGTVALGASASSGTINWYSSSTGGTSLETGTSFTTPSINTTTTYYVDATNNGCTSSSRIAVVATVNASPTITGTSPLSRCDAGTVALEATPSAGVINWYSDPTGGSSLQTGTSYTTPSINTTTTYYVEAKNNGCTSSSRTAILATVNTAPTITSTIPLSRCDAGTVVLGASASSGTINWYSSSTGGSSLQTGTSFTTPSINTTTIYYVDVTNNGCTSSSRTAILATVNTTPTITSTTPLSRCNAGTVVLGASASSGTINWYSSSTGGSFLQTGTSFTTPFINTTTSYYAEATNSSCISSTRTVVVATVKTIPVKPAIFWDGIQLSTTLTIENYQWLLNNNSIASASSSIFKPIEIGNYKIQITGVNGCKNESESFMLLVKADDNLVKIFPNPASKYVMVYLSQKPTQSLTMKLFNLQGQELKQIIINNQITYISLSEILVGNYVIKIFGNDFSQTKQLLIVQ